MLLLRNILFTFCFVSFTVTYTTFFLPVLVSERLTRLVVLPWAKMVGLLLRLLLNIRYDTTSAQALPAQAIYASKHQSAWETILYCALIPRPVFVLKKELLRIPLFGWYLWGMGCIPLDRSAGASALKVLLKKSKDYADQGYNLVIFPEGTRTPPGEDKPLLPGVLAMYKHLNLPVVPVALNSGLYWPKGFAMKKPGTVKVKFMQTIKAGMDKKRFSEKLTHQIHKGSEELLG
jgi:1-acyl-sn-glycerol-3-phosphate acyltransferase